MKTQKITRVEGDLIYKYENTMEKKVSFNKFWNFEEDMNLKYHD